MGPKNADKVPNKTGRITNSPALLAKKTNPATSIKTSSTSLTERVSLMRPYFFAKRVARAENKKNGSSKSPAIKFDGSGDCCVIRTAIIVSKAILNRLFVSPSNKTANSPLAAFVRFSVEWEDMLKSSGVLNKTDPPV